MQVQERIKAIWTSKLAVAKKLKGEQGLPRIIRLAQKLNLSEKESLVLIYAFVTQIARSRSHVSGLRQEQYYILRELSI